MNLQVSHARAFGRSNKNRPFLYHSEVLSEEEARNHIELIERIASLPDRKGKAFPLSRCRITSSFDWLALATIMSAAYPRPRAPQTSTTSDCKTTCQRAAIWRTGQRQMSAPLCSHLSELKKAQPHHLEMMNQCLNLNPRLPKDGNTVGEASGLW